MKLNIDPQLYMIPNQFISTYKFNHMFCWKMEMFFLPFINFSMMTPAHPAKPDDRMVRTAGSTGKSRVFFPDLAIWMEATLEVNSKMEAHCTLVNLLVILSHLHSTVLQCVSLILSSYSFFKIKILAIPTITISNAPKTYT